MKRFFTILSCIIAVFSLVASLSNLRLFAQGTKMQYEEITEGKEYWLGLPFCAREDGEAIRGNYPIALWISSKVDTRATVEDAQTGSKINVVIRANQITEVPYGDAVMMKESEVVRNFGIHIKGDDPISVAVYMSYRWSGEAYRVTPVEWLGKKYVTLNLYQDKTDKYKPCQILIVATDDNTTIKYTPKVNTEKANAGSVNTVNLRKGDCYLLLNRINPGLNQDNLTDLSGTYIESNKPITVISGHSKGAFPRYQSTFLGRPGNFMRNMMVDMMWPVELLGTRYISAPIKYADRPRNQIQDDKGDLIRFVASEDNTIIYQLRKSPKDSNDYMQISKVLRKGEFHDITNQEDAAYYKASKKVLVGQYGKTWWLYPVTPLPDKGGETPQNPSRNGQGMLLVLAPQSQWTSYATFRAPAQIDDFVYVTFNGTQLDKLKFDGRKFSAVFGNTVKWINGTDLAYITESISAGDHWIEGDTIDGGKNKAKFAAYAYGNWDRSKDGFAYGYPVGINYNTPCLDSIYIVATQVCGTVNGTVTTVQLTKGDTCAGIYNVTFVPDSSINYDFKLDDKFVKGVKTTTYVLTVQDMSKYAKARIKAQNLSGQTIYATYEYFPEDITGTPTLVDFGLLQVGDSPSQMIQLHNPTKTTVTVKDIYLKFGRTEFTIDKTGFPLTILPDSTVSVKVTATALVVGPPVKDSITIVLSCYEETPIGLVFTTGAPVVWISDQIWKDVPIGNEESKIVDIVNKSNVTVELYSITWPDTKHFTKVEGLPFPAKLTLKPNEQTTFTVWYKPENPGQIDSTRALFVGNTTVDKLYSDWIGNGVLPGPRIVGYDWKYRRVIDQWSVDTLGINDYQASITVGNDGDTKVMVDSLVIEGDVDNVFRLDKAQLGTLTQINAKESIPINAWFAPKAEKTYEAKVKLYTTWNGNPIVREDYLKGIGQQPHMTLTGKDFGPALNFGIGEYKKDFGTVSHVTNVNPMKDSVLEIKVIADPNFPGDVNAFVIDPVWLANKANWQNIAIGGTINVPITFTPTHQGEHRALLASNGDAPEHPFDTLIGRGFSVGLTTTPWDAGRIYIGRSVNNGQVTLKNTGSSDATIDQPYLQSNSEFKKIITNSETVNGAPVTFPLTLKSGEVLVVTLNFTPGANTNKEDVDKLTGKIKDFQDNVVYPTDQGIQYSKVTGGCKIFKIAVAVNPKGKVLNPGDLFVLDYMLKKADDETKSLDESEITQMELDVFFKKMGDTNEIFKDVYVEPYTLGSLNTPSNANLATIIQTQGNMLDGWMNSSSLGSIQENKRFHAVLNTDQKSLTTGNGKLFSMNMRAYLSDLSSIPLTTSFYIQGDATNWVMVTSSDGDVKVNAVCVNTLRLIQITGVTAKIEPPSPNPVHTTATINYSVGLNGYTNIAIYNTKGEKVLNLVDGYLKGGDYQLTLDVNALNLSSGAYLCKLVSGPTSISQEVVIQK